MNVEPSKAVANGSVASSSNSPSPKPFLANGGYSDGSYSYLSNEYSFPSGGIPSLRLPVVAILNLVFSFSCKSYYCLVIIFTFSNIEMVLSSEPIEKENVYTL